MKIYLTAINAKYIHSNLAVYSLRAFAKPFREQIEIGEFTINNRVDFILEEIYKAKPDVLCFSCYIWNMAYVEELITEFHKLRPEVPIWVGGPEVSYEVEDFLENHPEVTGIMVGEGEETFLEVCQYYVENKKERDLEEIKGLAIRGAQGVVVNTGVRPILDMGRIPFCYDKMGDFKNRIIYYESSRGCPFSCSYCLSSVEKHLRFRPLEMVKEELQFFIDKEVPQVKFVDRTFNCNHEHAMEIWHYIKEHDNGITNFHFEVSADLLREEELALIHDMRPGLIQLEIGVQSTNEMTITEIHRTMELERLKETVQQIQSGGNIHEHLDLIAGLPFEDYDTFSKSFNDIYAWKPNQLQLGFLKVLKGSYLFEHASEYGIVYHAKPPYEVMRTKWLSFEDVMRIKQVEEMLEVYYNSGQFEITIKILELFFDNAFLMFQKMGAFYEKKGYFHMSHSRIRRCEILLEFMKETLAEEEWEAAEKLLCEALTFDLYYRENCKSRPAWAPPLAEFKEVTREYCKRGMLSHIEPFHYRFPGKEIRTLEKLPERMEQPIYVLFDYEKRDLLDHQASVMVVREGVLE
ncbi:MAG: B12-binding domain-containing radical SAM protein [Roseburia sp.]